MKKAKVHMLANEAGIQEMTKEDLDLWLMRTSFKLCAGCGLPYDPKEYGAGWKYCDTACRVTQGGKIKLGVRSRGRPRRFPKADLFHRSEVINFLSQHKFKISALPHVDFLEDPHFCTIAVRGGFQFKICIGGSNRNEHWAHTCAYFKQGRIHFASTCRKKRMLVDSVDSSRQYKQCLPCNEPMKCLACRATHQLKDLLGLITPKETNLPLPESTIDHVDETALT